jgi:tRNA(Leu) C34 or U34 (ribose-2'-O)-methylase TrmL
MAEKGRQEVASAMTASVLLINPKYPHNVGTCLRAAACFGADGVYWTGTRVSLDVGRGERLPREERMRAYRDIPLERLDTMRPLNHLTGTPVAVELVPGAEELPAFEHPEDAVYVFGPEDGSLPKGIRTACHRFIRIPSAHCLNLSAACYVTLYDRMVKRWALGEQLPSVEDEQRGWFTSALQEA